jgi:hypothetical protein
MNLRLNLSDEHQKRNNKNINTFHKRKDLLDTPYVNGVKSVDGRKDGIRPLNQEEKDWLDKFNNEFVNGNFNKDKTDLHYSLIKKNEQKLARAKEALKRVNEKMAKKLKRGVFKTLPSRERAYYRAYRKRLVERKEALKRKIFELDFIKKSYQSDNQRYLDPLNYKGYRSINILDINVPDMENGEKSEEYILSKLQQKYDL